MVFWDHSEAVSYDAGEGLTRRIEQAKRDFQGPVDLAIAGTEWLVTVNQDSSSVSLIDAGSRSLADEVSCGEHPVALAVARETGMIVVSCAWGGELDLYSVESGRLRQLRSIPIESEPAGLAVTADGRKAFVGLMAEGAIAEVDLIKGEIARRLPVGHWPRSLALSPDGNRLAIGCSGESKIVVVDTREGKVLYEEMLSGGINIGHLRCSADSKFVYFPWMIYRTNPINVSNIRQGWVLASRVARVRLDGPAYREAISLDVPGMAVADPHGIAFSPDETRCVVAASGTHELLVYRNPDLPYVGAGGPGDLIDRRLLSDADLFYRIELGGRPMGVCFTAESNTVCVANHLRNSVQWVDIKTRRVTSEVVLGGIAHDELVQQGREIFYDGRRSLDQWYSCHTCHYDGGTNSKPMDTMNDGTPMTVKTVLPLYGVATTAPWTWHGWQTDLEESIQNSFTGTMQGKPVSKRELEAVVAFLKQLPLPPTSVPEAHEASARRGEILFGSSAANCAQCHRGEWFTDGEVHDVGSGSKSDHYKGYNTPSLRGVATKVRWMHDGRAKSLESVLSDHHSPDKVSGGEKLSDSQMEDLIAYLRSL